MVGKGYRKFIKQKEKRTITKTPLVFAAPIQKKEKNFKFPWLGIKISMVLILLVAAVYYFFFSASFRINEIIVEGNSLVGRDEIVAIIQPSGNNIFRFSSPDAEKILLEKFSQIRSLEIYKGIPDALKIIVAEREGRVVWQSGEKFYLIGSEGVVAKEILASEFLELPHIVDKKNLQVRPGERILSPSFVAFVINLNDHFFEAVNIKPSHFEVPETTFDINLYTDAGFFVKLNTMRSSKKQLESVKTIVANYRPDIHEYVDIRIDGWAYYK